MARSRALVAAALLCFGLLTVSACASQGPASSPGENSAPSGSTPDSEGAEGEADDGFSKSGVVLLLDSQFGVFGGESRWDGDTLIMAFEEELDAADGLEFAFVCGVMNDMVLAEHTTVVETPSGAADCAE